MSRWLSPLSYRPAPAGCATSVFQSHPLLKNGPMLDRDEAIVNALHDPVTVC